MAEPQLSPELFRRYDESDDALFYQVPRKVVHIDEGAIAAASQLYGELLPVGGIILDLMSAWRTHLPAAYKPSHVSGLGMNAEEMADNPQLDDFVVQNLNRNPALPFEANHFDAAICTVSVQYLTNPVAVFRDLYRVLKPNGVAVFTFSNRCFPTKAIAAWQSAGMGQKAGLVSEYLRLAGFADIHAEDRSPTRRRGLLGGSGDPLIGVWGFKPFSEQ
jgi:SAM-dependent methyltransferase